MPFTVPTALKTLDKEEINDRPSRFAISIGITLVDDVINEDAITDQS